MYIKHSRYDVAIQFDSPGQASVCYMLKCPILIISLCTISEGKYEKKKKGPFKAPVTTSATNIRETWQRQTAWIDTYDTPPIPEAPTRYSVSTKAVLKLRGGVF
ncbi:jg16281 [Pararge aegeria aegeria]|uniref:Jg16281 protein n=1 Tax=Pararge aegeria aegeria TaxID=348720 RepID=A0A8S4RX19_9NEOP|nr:jg16281 [Pararge aegeria aegeria]